MSFIAKASGAVDAYILLTVLWHTFAFALDGAEI